MAAAVAVRATRPAIITPRTTQLTMAHQIITQIQITTPVEVVAAATEVAATAQTIAHHRTTTTRPTAAAARAMPTLTCR